MRITVTLQRMSFTDFVFQSNIKFYNWPFYWDCNRNYGRERDLISIITTINIVCGKLWH